MKGKEFYSSKTIAYGNDFLQRRVKERVIDEKEQKLLQESVSSEPSVEQSM